MNLDTDRSRGIPIVRVKEARLIYPLLSEFATTVVALIESGERRVIVDGHGRALESTESRYPGDRYALDVRFVVEDGLGATSS